MRPMFLTPESFPEGKISRTLEIPTDPDFLGAFNGALTLLMDPDNWEQAGSITPEQAAAKAQEIILAMWEGETTV